MKHILETDIPELWPKIEPLVEIGLIKRDMKKRYPSWWIEDRLIDGHLQCWVVEDFTTIAITMLHIYPSGYKALEISMIVGEKIDKWLESYYSLMSNFAKINGCQEIFAIGRNGWQHKLKLVSDDSVERESLIRLEI